MSLVSWKLLTNDCLKRTEIQICPMLNLQTTSSGTGMNISLLDPLQHMVKLPSHHEHGDIVTSQ